MNINIIDYLYYIILVEWSKRVYLSPHVGRRCVETVGAALQRRGSLRTLLS